MYGKDFHQWREAQEIIRQIGVEDSEVREMVSAAFNQTADVFAQLGSVAPMSPRQIEVATQAGLLQHRINSIYEQQQAAGLGGIFGRLFS